MVRILMWSKFNVWWLWDFRFMASTLSDWRTHKWTIIRQISTSNLALWAVGETTLSASCSPVCLHRLSLFPHEELLSFDLQTAQEGCIPGHTMFSLSDSQHSSLTKHFSAGKLVSRVANTNAEIRSHRPFEMAGSRTHTIPAAGSSLSRLSSITHGPLDSGFIKVCSAIVSWRFKQGWLVTRVTAWPIVCPWEQVQAGSNETHPNTNSKILNHVNKRDEQVSGVLHPCDASHSFVGEMLHFPWNPQHNIVILNKCCVLARWDRQLLHVTY